MKVLIHLRKHLVRIIPRSCRSRRYFRLDHDHPSEAARANSSNSTRSRSYWCKWKWVKQKAMRLGNIMCSASADQPPAVPKGFLAVYVGSEESRVVLPLVYFNHPLFNELLKEAEDEFGYEHRQGGIKLPCRISEFQKVQSTIENDCFGGGGRRKLINWGRRKPRSSSDFDS